MISGSARSDGNNPRQITHFNGQDHSPSWSPDGKFIYYVSEQHGTPANVVRLPVDRERGRQGEGGEGGERGEGGILSPCLPLSLVSPSPPLPLLPLSPSLVSPSPPLPLSPLLPLSRSRPTPEQLTFHKDEGVRRARLSGNGQWIVYECGPDLWVLSLHDGSFRKLAIEANADDKTNVDQIVTFTADATEFSLSHDEKHMAFVVHGEIFLIRASGGKAKRLTDHPAYDHGPAWSPDGKKIVFLSDRGGHEDVYLLDSDDPDHADLHLANHFKVKQLTKTVASEEGVTFSPDGKKISFVRAGQLITMNPDGSEEKILVKDGAVIDYVWSPDSHWICYARMDGSFASELYIIPATGATAADPPRNITRFATYNAGVTWSRKGNQLGFVSQRQRNSTSALCCRCKNPPHRASRRTGRILIGRTLHPARSAAVGHGCGVQRDFQ